MASDTKMVLERNGNKQPADAVFSLLLDQTLSNITIICEGQKEEKINEYQTLYVKQLGFYYKTDDNNYKRITCLDFKYHNGNTYVEGPRVRDGVSVAELNYDLDHTNLHCIYNYDSSETPLQLQEMVKDKKNKPSQSPTSTSNSTQPRKKKSPASLSRQRSIHASTRHLRQTTTPHGSTG